ncbi:MAG: polysaccharide deacetylase [Parvibaculaceae bacterium]
MTTTVCLTFDFDALSLWIGTLRQTSPTPLSRGEYGARVGVPRILELLDRHGIKATFFVPGHTALTFPESVREIVAAGHEIGAHNLVHETPVDLEPAEEALILDRAEAALESVAGVRPVGYRSPAWDLSPSTIALLVERGYLYDSSMMADDFSPYRPRFRDRIGGDGEVAFGEEAPIWEFPVAWELDDFPYFHYSHKVSGRGLRSPEEVGDIWLAEFDYCRRHVTDGVFTLTTHPQIIGRGPRIAMLDRLIGTMRPEANVCFSTMAEAARRLQETQETKR